MPLAPNFWLDQLVIEALKTDIRRTAHPRFELLLEEEILHGREFVFEVALEIFTGESGRVAVVLHFA